MRRNVLIPMASLGLLACAPVFAQDELPESWNLKFQTTYVQQHKASLRSAYAGPNSLSAEPEDSNSLTLTLAAGLRLATRTELYANLEGAQGTPLSNLTGLGGFSNGEMARSSGPKLKLYLARLFLRHTWATEDEEAQPVESAANQLAGQTAARRWVLSVGNMAVLDLFDANAYSHDPRTQFLNWTLMTHGAYDYAGDARGYSWGAVLERFDGDWTWRVGRFAQPREPNQQALDTQLDRHYGDQLELEHAHEWRGQPGRLRLLWFRNRARMARYDDALALAAHSGEVPQLEPVRLQERTKRGLGLNLEQALSARWGLFARLSRADGKTETYAFTEVDRSVAAGVSGRGVLDSRPNDVMGLAMARNGLSASHRDFLARGGQGFFLGDGRLNYRAELITEAFYSLALTKTCQLGLDWQRVANPGYNADRGPARIWSLRLHAEL